MEDGLSALRQGLNPTVKWGCAGNGNQRLRIGIGMLSSPGIPPYAHSTEAINLAYAQKHGYDFVAERCPDDVDCEWKWKETDQYRLVWYKAKFIAKHLPSYHIFVFLDSDAYVVNREQRIEDFVAKEVRDDQVVLMLAQDCKTDRECWQPDAPNTGVIFAINRPADRSHKLLQDWVDAAEHDDGVCVQWRNRHPREQACLGTLMQMSRDAGSSVQIVTPGSKMGQQDGNFIRHLVASDSVGRMGILGSEHMKLVGSPVVQKFHREVDKANDRRFVLFATMCTTMVVLAAVFLAGALVLSSSRRRRTTR